MSNIEQTLSIIKPDAVERNLENEIKEMFKNNGFSILKEKKIQIEKTEAENFYKVHETKPFYNDLCEYLSSGPIVVMVLEKENAVLGNRELMGATNPKDAEEGSIRKKYGISIDKNSVHGSDSVDNAKIGFCFAKEPILKPTLSGRLAIGRPMPFLIVAKSFALPKKPNLPGVAPNALAALNPLTRAGPAILAAFKAAKPPAYRAGKK